MKKDFLRIIAALLLVLSITSCSQLMGDTLKEPDEPSPPVETPEGGDKPEPTEPEPEPEPEATGVDEYGFTVWPEGNYLADSKFDTDEYLPDYDADNGFFTEIGMFGRFACSTKDTAYIAKRTNLYQRSFFLMFTDKATGITLPLCGRPECTHDGEDCNSYMGQDSYSLQIYDGKIYWMSMIDLEYSLMRMNLDGTGREEAMRFDFNFVRTNGVMHRGYLYFAFTEGTVTDGEAHTEYKVLAQPLDGGEMFTILDQVRTEGSYERCFAIPTGNDLYIVLSGREVDGNFVEIFRWSSKSRTSELLYKSSALEHEITYRPYLKPEDGLYFTVSDTLMHYSFEDGTFEEICTPELEKSAGAKMVTDDHIAVCEHYKSEENSVEIYDYDGNLVTETEPLGKLLSILDWNGEDDEYVYLQYTGETGGKNLEGVFAIPLDGGEIIEIEWETLD